jgi:hypothetical protein
VDNFLHALARDVSLFWALGFSGGATDGFGVFLLLLGMLLCVGCLVPKAYPTGF